MKEGIACIKNNMPSEIIPQQGSCKGLCDDGVFVAVLVADAAVFGPAQFSLTEVGCVDGSLTTTGFLMMPPSF